MCWSNGINVIVVTRIVISWNLVHKMQFVCRMNSSSLMPCVICIIICLARYLDIQFIAICLYFPEIFAVSISKWMSFGIIVCRLAWKAARSVAVDLVRLLHWLILRKWTYLGTGEQSTTQQPPEWYWARYQRSAWHQRSCFGHSLLSHFANKSAKEAREKEETSYLLVEHNLPESALFQWTIIVKWCRVQGYWSRAVLNVVNKMLILVRLNA